MSLSEQYAFAMLSAFMMTNGRWEDCMDCFVGILLMFIYNH